MVQCCQCPLCPKFSAAANQVGGWRRVDCSPFSQTLKMETCANPNVVWCVEPPQTGITTRLHSQNIPHLPGVFRGWEVLVPAQHRISGIWYCLRSLVRGGITIWPPNGWGGCAGIWVAGAGSKICTYLLWMFQEGSPKLRTLGRGRVPLWSLIEMTNDDDGMMSIIHGWTGSTPRPPGHLTIPATAGCFFSGEHSSKEHLDGDATRRFAHNPDQHGHS